MFFVEARSTRKIKTNCFQNDNVKNFRNLHRTQCKVKLLEFRVVGASSANPSPINTSFKSGYRWLKKPRYRFVHVGSFAISTVFRFSKEPAVVRGGTITAAKRLRRGRGDNKHLTPAELRGNRLRNVGEFYLSTILSAVRRPRFARRQVAKMFRPVP